MHGYWPFEYALPSGPRRRVFALFCSAMNPDVNDVAQCIVDYCEIRRPPDRIYLIAPQSEGTAVAAVLVSPTFLDRVRDVTRSVDQPNAECLLFDADGVTRDGEQAVVPASVLNPLKGLGLKYLIDKHPVFLVAPPAHHFVVPSEWHADVFFRIGSAMADGAAIDFLAYCCLPFFAGREVKHIYCDTGAISPVAYAINALRGRIPPARPAATVSSFGSYKGLLHFKFRDMARSVMLISVSTSGGLARLLCKPGNDIQESDIVTLFTLYEPGGSAKVVCNLRKDEANPEGFDQVNNYPEDDCPLCRPVYYQESVQVLRPSKG